MFRTSLIALAAVLLAALLLAAPALSYPVGASSVTPAWLEAAPPAPTVDTIAPTPLPEPQACPSTPASLDPIAACPFDPTSDYAITPGDDDQMPLSFRCNYNSGDSGNPCPHSRVGDPLWYFQCDPGNPDPFTAGTIGVEFGWPETDQAGRDDVTSICAGPWRSLSLS